MIHVSRPEITTEDVEAVSRVLGSGQVSSATSIVVEFEETFAATCDRRYGIAVANGTVALELAIECLELPRDTKLIMPSFTIISCALAAIRNGLTPSLVDVDSQTWCLQPDLVVEAVDADVSGVMAVHMYGHPADVTKLEEVCDQHGIPLVEDAAEAHGARYQEQGSWRPCGSFGTVSCFSFYANKPITTGEGGMLVTDDERLADKAKRLRNLAFGGGRRFLHDELGHNYRMGGLQAALGLSQTSRLEEIVEKKRTIAKWYSDRLGEHPRIQLPTERPNARSIYWMFGVLIQNAEEKETDGICARLFDAGIETRPFFLGLHEQPALQSLVHIASGMEHTESLSRSGFYLPSSHTLTRDEVGQVSDALIRVLDG